MYLRVSGRQNEGEVNLAKALVSPLWHEAGAYHLDEYAQLHAHISNKREHVIAQTRKSLL